MTAFVCSEPACHQRYPIDSARWRCDCGGLLHIESQLTFDLDAIAKAPINLWRYRSAFPLPDSAVPVSFSEGFTPLTEVDIGTKRQILVKQEQLFPTGSYKDRGASLLLSYAKAIGATEVVEDSSGNAGCSVAAYAAKAGIRCRILVPANTSPAKLTQIRGYGAELELIPGDRAATAAAALEAAQATFYASHSWNPFFFQGTKTFAYETCEQLGWKAPDTVILPAGNGTLLIGAYLGFSELLAAGIIGQLPKLVAVQSIHCNPLHNAFAEYRKNPEKFRELPTIPSQPTLAEGIAIAQPVRGLEIMQAVNESDGQFISVSDSEIKDTLKTLAGQGHWIEPTSAATIAGAAQYCHDNTIANERIVSVFTGHGLKSSEKLSQIF